MSHKKRTQGNLASEKACLQCGQDTTNRVKSKNYYGTVSYARDTMPMHKECYKEWWDDLTWHLDTLDERMNANIYFKRTEGLKGTYEGKPVDASWNGLEARHFLGEYKFKNRRPHPDTCDKCCLM